MPDHQVQGRSADGQHPKLCGLGLTNGRSRNESSVPWILRCPASPPVRSSATSPSTGANRSSLTRYAASICFNHFSSSPKWEISSFNYSVLLGCVKATMNLGTGGSTPNQMIIGRFPKRCGLGVWTIFGGPKVTWLGRTRLLYQEANMLWVS